MICKFVDVHDSKLDKNETSSPPGSFSLSQTGPNPYIIYLYLGVLLSFMVSFNHCPLDQTLQLKAHAVSGIMVMKFTLAMEAVWR